MSLKGGEPIGRFISEKTECGAQIFLYSNFFFFFFLPGCVRMLGITCQALGL